MSVSFECWWDSVPELLGPRWRAERTSIFGPFSGITTNPMLMLEAARSLPLPAPAESGWELYLACAERSARHLADLGLSLPFCVQLDPRLAADTGAMLDQAAQIMGRIPQATLKVPLTSAGIAAMGPLAASGVPINATLGFCVAQLVAAARTIAASGGPPRRHVLTLMQGRLGDFGLSAFVGPEPRRVRAAESVVFHAAYEALRPYRGTVTLLTGSLRPGPDQECWNYADKIGKEVIATLPPSFLDKVGLPLSGRDFGRVDDRLYEQALSDPDVRRYAAEDGFTPAESDRLAPLIRTHDEMVRAITGFDALSAGSPVQHPRLECHMSTNTHSSAQRFAAEEPTLAKLAWRRADVEADGSWRIPVTPDVLDEYRAFLAEAGDPAVLIETAERADLDLPHLAHLAEHVREQVFGRFGFALLTGLDGRGLSEEQLRLFYVLTGLHLGELLTPYNRTHDVYDRGYDYRSSDVSVSKTRVRAPFHTDSTSKRVFPNVFGLLCVRPAKEGGRNLLVSACQVYRQIAEQTPEHLPPLFKDHFRNTVTPGDEETPIRDNAYPIFTWDVFAAGPTLRYLRHWIETAYAKVGESVDARDAAAFDRLDAVMEDEENVFGLDLEAGEMIFINNAVVAHNRTEFTDHPEPGRHRLLVRAWLRVPDGL